MMIHVTIDLLAAGLFALIYLAARRRDLRRIADLRKEFAEAIGDLVTWSERAYTGLSRDIKQLQDQLIERDRSDGVQSYVNSLDKRHHVISLAEKGLGVDEISQKLAVPKGEAELIINLRRYKKA